MLAEVNKEAERKEKIINEQLYTFIDEKKSFIFNAGAGAGKTFSLAETLKYVCRFKEELLNYHNQRVLCITYTNVAAEELRRRLGSSELVEISTIHEFLWNLICAYQKQLVEIHLDNVIKELDGLSEYLRSVDWWNNYSNAEKSLIEVRLLSDRNQYYAIEKEKAVDFRKGISIFLGLPAEFKISNVTEFKKTCKAIIKKKQYEKCIEGIRNKEQGYTSVEYNTRSNYDVLYRMRISHDTLLEYANKLIKNINILKQMIIDNYPYAFVDEYQDTDQRVVDIFCSLSNYAKEIKHPFVTGFFGDSAQNIYSDGIGERINDYCDDSYEKVYKVFNRRSCDEIINVANSIRNDGIVQKSIYNDSNGGSVQLYYGSEGDVGRFIARMADELREISNNDEVHCFVLMNKEVAKYVGIEPLFDWFNNTPYYKRHWDVLSTELLSNEPGKLGVVERYLYNIMCLKEKISRRDTRIGDIFSKELLRNRDLEQLRNLVSCVEVIQGETLEDILNSIEIFAESLKKILGNEAKDIVDNEMKRLIGIENYSSLEFRSIVQDVLQLDPDSNVSQLSGLFNMEEEILNKWYQYITRNYSGSNLIFHTFHGTKGLEFDNVILVLGDSFGKMRPNMFADFFDRYTANVRCVDDDISARNLLYVAVSRAKKNIRILYTGSFDRNKNSLEEIFGRAQPWDEKQMEII